MLEPHKTDFQNESDYWDALIDFRKKEHKAKTHKRRVVLSDAPCTPSCWYANPNSDCQCSCGSKNHGINCNPAELIQE